MATILTIPKTIIHVNNSLVQSGLIADGVTSLVLTLDRTITPNGMNTLTAASSYTITVDESYDNGVTWSPDNGGTWVQFVQVGGIIDNFNDKTGDFGTRLSDVMTTTLQDANVPGRTIRFTALASGTNIAVAGTLDIS